MQINFCDTSKFGFSRAIGGILFIFSQDTNFILHWQSIYYKVLFFLRQSLKYIPQNVYKCFCKYAVSCLPQNQIGFFQKTIDWINAPANYRRLPMVASCSVDYTTPLFSLCIRKEQDYRYPYCWASLNIANVRYMFIVPFSSQDRYSFTTKARYQFFLDILRSWFPVLDMQPMQLSSSKSTHYIYQRLA